jgi:thioredoxin-like negative regulator of GroEL
LACALGFAALLNLALASSLLWTELLPTSLRNVVWLVVAVVWVVSVVISWRWDRQQVAAVSPAPASDRFVAAQDHYLKGNWFEAERLLQSLLERNPRDWDAGLMLASLLRHTRRYDEARQALDRLERFEGFRKWRVEMDRERELLQEASREEAAGEDEAVRDGPEQPAESSPAALAENAA